MSTTPETTQPDQPIASTPDARAEQEGRQTEPNAAPTPAVEGPGSIPASTQSNMGDGAGIRGDYGNASQTNGLEGGPDSAADGSPKEQ
ncbi:hypothetical protein SAMN02745146_0006 [Hymenobacter daecheongensis DSM 21074]|uniref:Uncharacterized protein n=1 Tax=Hymenobacter daecheongensis DSM 21074 TaxID=1121955 RepID=A0A1M6LPW0_9BACT|nr:hypothetical protein [Hymenobacter daecheongensis]SHJ73237.1 hypothetical protein SAMN02745146_0006 [Hymenobacter daecheongensis DSM 21074]